MQAKYLQRVIGQDLLMALEEMIAKSGVMIEPPKALPVEDKIMRAVLSRAIELVNGGVVAGGRSPIDAIPMRKGANTWAG